MADCLLGQQVFQVSDVLLILMKLNCKSFVEKKILMAYLAWTIYRHSILMKQKVNVTMQHKHSTCRAATILRYLQQQDPRLSTAFQNFEHHNEMKKWEYILLSAINLLVQILHLIKPVRTFHNICQVYSLSSCSNTSVVMPTLCSYSER